MADRAQPGFDEVLTTLKGVVEKLESGQLSLEAALGAFEEGVRLARQGAQILDAAERRVEILLRDGDEAGAVRPFESPEKP